LCFAHAAQSIATPLVQYKTIIHNVTWFTTDMAVFHHGRVYGIVRIKILGVRMTSWVRHKVATEMSLVRVNGEEWEEQ